MLSRIEIMGSIVPPAPLPYHLLHFAAYDQMARDVPSAGGESRPPRQGSTLLGRRTYQRPREVFRTYAVVYKRGGGSSVEA